MDLQAIAPIVVASRVLAGLVFLTAAASKLDDPVAFRGSVAAYHLLPRDLIAAVAITVPWFELALGLLTPIGVLPFATSAASMVLFAVFAGAMSINLIRGRREIGCGCFGGKAPQRLGWAAVARTLALAAVAAIAAAPVAVAPGVALQGLAAGATLFLLYIAGAVLPAFERRRPRILI